MDRIYRPVYNGLMKQPGWEAKIARIFGANYTDEASLKHTNTLITVDRDAIGSNNSV